MKRLLLTALALGGCLSDLAVGMSTREIRDEDAALPGALDAGMPKLDASSGGPVIYGDDAAPARYDAGQDAGRDAGPTWRPCLAGDCNLSFIGIDRCADGREPLCARPYPDRICEFTCDAR